MLRLETRTRVGAVALDVALSAEPGRALALAGPSGAGKTTLLRVAAGLLRPEAGLVRCGDRTWLDTSRGVCLAPESRGCGLVFQDYALFPHLSARDNVAFGLRGMSRAQRRRRADEELARFGLAGRAAARPGELSGGERQRVALARTLAPRPRALLLDEPLAALDPRSRAGARRELAALLAAVDVPVMIVTHDFAEASLLAGEVAILDAGRVVQQGPAAQLAASPASAFVADFAGATVLAGTARGGPGGLSVVALAGGGEVLSTDTVRGPVAVSVFPWEVALEPPGGLQRSSSQNRLDVRVATVSRIANRVRVGLEAPQPLAAELTGPAVERLRLAPGDRLVATWKATATRLVPR